MKSINVIIHPEEDLKILDQQESLKTASKEKQYQERGDKMRFIFSFFFYMASLFFFIPFIGFFFVEAKEPLEPMESLLGLTITFSLGLAFFLIGRNISKGGRSWRNDQATIKQKDFADNLGIQYRRNITKGELSDLISEVTGR